MPQFGNVASLVNLLGRDKWQNNYGNLKWCESRSFSGDIESLEPSKF